MNKPRFPKLSIRLGFRRKKAESAGELPDQLKKILGVEPLHPDWYRKALTHPGMNLRDERGNLYNYERLEFLGDAVLSLVVAEYLFRKYPGKEEGDLTELKSKIVSRKNLNRLGHRWKLRQTLPRNKKYRFGDDLEGNLVEALIGALYMDRGFEEAKKFVIRKIINANDLNKIQREISSYKTEIIHWCQKHRKPFRFEYQQEKQADGHYLFHVRLLIDGRLAGRGRSSSKKKAEEIASRNAYRHLVKK